MQQILPEIKDKGVTFVAISPELPNTSLTTTEKHALTFPVLTDLNNKFAGELGIVFHQSEEMRTHFESRGVDMKERTGQSELDVPVPATLLVGRDGIVKNLYLETTYSNRLEPSTALEWIAAL